MKICHWLVSGVVGVGAAFLAFGESAPSPAPKEDKTTLVQSPSSAEADLGALVARVKEKLQQGQASEADLAPDLAAFDALAAKYQGQKTEAVAMIPYMKAALYVEVLKEPEKALPIFAQIQKDFPGTQAALQAAKAARLASIQVLAPGAAAPDFTAKAVDGGAGSVSLSQFKGKVVIVDFWATWCGPCQHSLPHMEKVYEGVKDQGVVVLGVCSWDSQDNFKQWLPDHQKSLTFTFAMDPAERDQENSIATRLYGVTGIPTTYVIGKDGKVAAAIVGFGGDDDHRVEDALQGVGVKVSTM